MSPRDENPISRLTRRRWLATVVAGMGTALVGCDRVPKERRTDRPPASGSSFGGDDRPNEHRIGLMQSPAPPWVDDPVLNRAVVWLWSQQHYVSFKDLPPNAGMPIPGTYGGWNSKKYAQLQSGQALTPLVYFALQHVPYAARPSKELWSQAEDYLWTHTHDGVIGADDPNLLEYPNYATALALQCRLPKSRSPEQTERNATRMKKMVNYLAAQQYNESNGFSPEHPAYGGWGFGGPRPVGTSPGHMDLGHTRHVLQALRRQSRLAWNAEQSDPQIYARAEKFLHRMQKRDTPGFDGGFFFSPIVLPANKGGEETIDGKSYFRSYATATCDGILALLACGVRQDDERITSAIEWLKKHPRLDYPEGVLEGTDTNWGASIRYYHFAVRAECYAALDWPGDWRKELHAILEKRQQPDGSFVNHEGFLMKEDDPLLCTALAIIALSQ